MYCQELCYETCYLLLESHDRNIRQRDTESQTETDKNEKTSALDSF